MFFLIYVNKLVIQDENVSITQYCDDTSGNIKNKKKAMAIDIAKKFIFEINLWFKIKKLKLNAGKSVIIHFKLNSWINNDIDDIFQCENKQIDFAESSKLLGIIIDRKLNWQDHINLLCKKLAKAVYAIRIIKKIVSQETIVLVYFAYFHSLLTYGLEIWGNAVKYLTERVFKMQKKVIRIICNLLPSESCREAFKALNILPMPALYIYKSLLFLKKNPHYFENNIKTHKYETRHKDLYDVDCHNTTAKERGLHYSAIKFYNNLPKCLREENNINKFKKELKILLLEKNVYSVQDFHDLHLGSA